jgi:hypothetical protein
MLNRLLVLLAAALVAPAAHAACASPSTNAQLVAEMDRATELFGKLEVDGFQDASKKASTLLECLSEPVSRSTAASFHRVRGLALFLDRDSPAARRSFAAARAIEPAYTFPTDIVPTGNPILDDYTAVDASEGQTETIPEPKIGSVRVDGSGSLSRSKSVPAIIQLLDGRGAVAHTVLLQPDAALPDFLTSAEQVAPVKPDSSEKTAKKGPKVPLLASAVAGLVVAGGLYGGSFGTRAAYEGSTTLEELNSRRGLTNGLVIGSGVVGALAVGAGATSFVLSGRF